MSKRVITISVAIVNLLGIRGSISTVLGDSEPPWLSRSIPSLYYKRLVDSSSVFLRNPNISCPWLQLGKEKGEGRKEGKEEGGRERDLLEH